MARQPVSHPTPRLRLRQFRGEDAEALHACFGDAGAMRFWDHPAHTKRSETERSVRRFVDCTPSAYRFWAVADAETDRCAGMVNYHDGNMRNKRVTIGYIIDPARQRQGLAIEAVSALLAFCFGELGLHRVQALIDPDNAASRGLVERLGFRQEGLLRDHLRVAGVWHSCVLYAVLATDRDVLGSRRLG